MIGKALILTVIIIILMLIFRPTLPPLLVSTFKLDPTFHIPMDPKFYAALFVFVFLMITSITSIIFDSVLLFAAFSVVVLLYAKKIPQVGGSIVSSVGSMFDPEFYVAQPVTIRTFSSIDKSIFPPAKTIYTEAPAEYQFTDAADPLEAIEKGQLDLAIMKDKGSVQRFKGFKSIRFVGNVMDSNLMLMSPNQYPIQDLTDLKTVQSAVIQVPDQSTADVVTDLLSEYPDITGIKIRIGNGTEKPIMYAFMVVHPSRDIANLVKSEPMHVVTMSKINNGNYLISDTEKPFFEKHRIYEKSSFDMHNQGVKFYPGLSIRGQLLYYPTIKSKYTLYAHADFSQEAVKKILQKILDKRIMPVAEVGYNPEETVPTHRGAREIYQKLKIYTKEPRQPIWQGF